MSIINGILILEGGPPCAAVRVEEDGVAGGELERGGHEESSADQSPPHGAVLRGAAKCFSLSAKYRAGRPICHKILLCFSM